MRFIYLIFFITICLISCDKPIDLDLNQTPTKVVIEAQVTDNPGYQFVKLTRSADFYGSGKTPRITNATVTVSDDLGKVVIFVHNPNSDKDSMGIYVPQVPF